MPTTYFEKISSFYRNQRLTLATLSAFLIPIKLSLLYLVLCPSILLFLIAQKKNIRATLQNPIFVPYLFFIISIIISSFFGLNIERSLSALPSLLFFSIAIFFYADVVRSEGLESIFTALLLGQTCAALHTILDATFPGQIPGFFPGKVSESGQLAMTIVLTLGFLLIRWEHSTTLSKILGIDSLGEQHLRLNRITRTFPKFLTPIFLILLAALLINLKRGPWAGVFIATALLFRSYAKRYVIPTLILVVLLIASVAPIRERIQSSWQHFLIPGGRGVIWEIGAELAQHYPLGIGYHNSSMLPDYSPEIPPNLRHFHSNFLQIIVESGWLTFFIYSWWLFVIFKSALSLSTKDSPHGIIVSILGCSLLAWQIAGLVEFNLGDSEVFVLAALIIGALGASTKEVRKNKCLNMRSDMGQI